jgi:predicted  nucleic acid-binding Zn-ribbon protein
VAVAVLILATLATALPVAAQDVENDPDVKAARAAVEQAQAEAHAAADKVEQTKQQLADVETQMNDVKAQIADIEAKIPVLRAKQADLRKKLRNRAAALYANGGPLLGPGDVPLEPSIKAVRRQQLADAAAKQDTDTRKALKATEGELKKLKVDLGVKQDQLTQQRADLQQLQGQLEQRQVEMNARVAEANAALERARRIGALRARGEPIQGPAVLTGPQLAAWWRSQSYSFRVPGTNIDELAQIYIDEGNAEGVRGDLAFAQSMVETGGFRSSPANNFAGLGWCDSCSHGTSFPTARDGVRAQIQHLLNYADPSSRASGLHNPPSPYWYGSDPGRAARNFDTFFAKGWAPTWNDMGHGNWATDRAYSGKVLGIYQRMIAFTNGG